MRKFNNYPVLANAELKQIVSIELSKLADRLLDRNIRISVDDSTMQYIADIGYDPVYGARPLKRTIQRQLESPLAKGILEQKFQPGDSLLVSHDINRGIVINKR